MRFCSATPFLEKQELLVGAGGSDTLSGGTQDDFPLGNCGDGLDIGISCLVNLRACFLILSTKANSQVPSLLSWASKELPCRSTWQAVPGIVHVAFYNYLLLVVS